MKHAETDTFWADWDRLSRREQELFIAAVRRLNEAFARRGGRRVPNWPSGLRVRPMSGRPGIWEMTWSFAGPDGRATFELIDFDGEPGSKWRRVGTHAIYTDP